MDCVAERSREMERDLFKPVEAPRSEFRVSNVGFSCRELWAGAFAGTSKFTNEAHHTGVLPIDGADDFFGQAPLAIEDIAFRKLESAVARSQALVRISCDRKCHVKLGDEFLNSAGILIHADADDLHSRVAHLF